MENLRRVFLVLVQISSVENFRGVDNKHCWERVLTDFQAEVGYFCFGHVVGILSKQ